MEIHLLNWKNNKLIHYNSNNQFRINNNSNNNSNNNNSNNNNNNNSVAHMLVVKRLKQILIQIQHQTKINCRINLNNRISFNINQ